MKAALFRRSHKTSMRILGFIALALFLFTSGSRANDFDVSAGNVAYVTHQPWLGIWMKGGFVTTIQGPAHYPWTFKHLTVQQIKVTPTNYDEQFELLDKDQVKITFQVHFTLHPNPDRIREVVEKYSGAQWYESVVQQPLRSIVRDSIGNMESMMFTSRQHEVETTIQNRTKEFLADKPFVIEKASVGNLVYPESVTTAAANRLAAQQTLQQREIEIKTAQANARIRAAEAEGIRRAQEIINATLTPIYVQHEFIQAMRDIASKPGNTVIYVPLGPTGMPMMTDPGRHVQIQREQAGVASPPNPSSVPEAMSPSALPQTPEAPQQSLEPST